MFSAMRYAIKLESDIIIFSHDDVLEITGKVNDKFSSLIKNIV